MPVRSPRLAFAFLVACALPVAAGAQSPAPPVARLLADLQAHYDRIADFSADFEHHYAGGVLRTTDVERGTMHVKKPRRWRFDYVDPEPKLFVCDGTTIHSWFPADRQVIVSPVPAGAGASTSAALLAGEGDLLRDFTARYAAGPPPDGAWSIELRPVAGDAGTPCTITSRTSGGAPGHARSVEAAGAGGLTPGMTFDNVRIVALGVGKGSDGNQLAARPTQETPKTGCLRVRLTTLYLSPSRGRCRAGRVIVGVASRGESR